VVHHANRKNDIERSRLEREVLQIGLNESDVRQKSAQLRRLVDGMRVIGPVDIGSRLTGHLAVAPPAATGIEHALAGQFAQSQAGFGLKRGTVFIIVSDFVLVPLQAEAGQVIGGNESRNSPDDRPPLAARGAEQIPLPVSQ
jgi:hypothetical protein